MGLSWGGKLMDEKSQKQMTKMVDAIQPHCDEQIVAAMTCSHSGSMKSAVVGSVLGGLLGGAGSSCDLPNPVFIAVGPQSIYAFDFKPRGFNYKIKKEVARWPRDETTVETDRGSGMARLVLTTKTGETYPLEITTALGGGQLVDAFFEALR
jgi:hypothetical protein